ncbi:apolipoprotein N-acyltransferase [Deinococcus aquiradiocola]|uniref:apolipoprotein N-acyltransferase n=1 Tax=Deinococcus aquiradiocola TaxID=393059 RepID=UPI001E5ED8E4|nr:apolipoprotein N-acyltransferase [Deinococcus aquiradiocola]
MRRNSLTSRARVRVSWPHLLAVIAAGVLLALCGLPLAWSAVTPVPLALALWLVASGGSARNVAGRMFWLTSAYFAVQLSWLTRFMTDLSGLPFGGALVVPLFLLEGAFYAVMALVAVSAFRDRLARVWALAGGWVVLEWLRTLGPLAFPWSDLGYTLLPTPAAQTADLWGKLGLTFLVTFTAASLVSLALRRYAAPVIAALLWAGSWAYGTTRAAQDGPTRQALVLRSAFDSFGRASGNLTAEQQFQTLTALSADTRPGEIVVWSETALIDQADLGRVPGPGIYGVYRYPNNSAVSWDGTSQGSVTYDKLKPVPMGEYFPFETGVLRPVWEQVFNLLGFRFDPPPIGQSTRPLPLQGVLYGTYICYDSIFSWVPRQLTLNGAQVLVNISNDGWYKGWGVTQHFQMGRMRAIETRRWVLRSVNEGVAASIDDLGRPVRTLGAGAGALHVTYRVLNGRTVYVTFGDWPALTLALLLLGAAGVRERRSRRPNI